MWGVPETLLLHYSLSVRSTGDVNLALFTQCEEYRRRYSCTTHSVWRLLETLLLHYSLSVRSTGDVNLALFTQCEEYRRRYSCTTHSVWRLLETLLLHYSLSVRSTGDVNLALLTQCEDYWRRYSCTTHSVWGVPETLTLHYSLSVRSTWDVNLALEEYRRRYSCTTRSEWGVPETLLLHSSLSVRSIRESHLTRTFHNVVWNKRVKAVSPPDSMQATNTDSHLVGYRQQSCTAHSISGVLETLTLHCSLCMRSIRESQLTRRFRNVEWNKHVKAVCPPHSLQATNINLSGCWVPVSTHVWKTKQSWVTESSLKSFVTQSKEENRTQAQRNAAREYPSSSASTTTQNMTVHHWVPLLEEHDNRNTVLRSCTLHDSASQLRTAW